MSTKDYVTIVLVVGIIVLSIFANDITRNVFEGLGYNYAL